MWLWVLQDDKYEFPYVMLCVFERQGCGYADESMCIESAHYSDNSYVEYNKEIVPDAVVDSQLSWALIPSFVCFCSCRHLFHFCYFF